MTQTMVVVHWELIHEMYCCTVTHTVSKLDYTPRRGCAIQSTYKPLTLVSCVERGVSLLVQQHCNNLLNRSTAGLLHRSWHGLTYYAALPDVSCTVNKIWCMADIMHSFCRRSANSTSTSPTTATCTRAAHTCAALLGAGLHILTLACLSSAKRVLSSQARTVQSGSCMDLVPMTEGDFQQSTDGLLTVLVGTPFWQHRAILKRLKARIPTEAPSQPGKPDA